MSVRAEAIITAGLRPDLFAGRGVLANSKTLVFAALIVLVLAGFGFRVTGLSAEGISEDELNKLNAVADYRANGLTGANGEHPMLMKVLMWGSLNAVPASDEVALRLPNALIGALTTLVSPRLLPVRLWPMTIEGRSCTTRRPSIMARSVSIEAIAFVSS